MNAGREGLLGMVFWQRQGLLEAPECGEGAGAWEPRPPRSVEGAVGESVGLQGRDWGELRCAELVPVAGGPSERCPTCLAVHVVF